MTKKKKTFRKFINEQVLGVKQKEKQFDKFEDFVKDVKGIKPPENKAASFQEFINEARGYEFDNDSVDKFDKMVIESKIEREQQKLEERKTRIDPNPIVLTNEQIEEMNRRRIIEEINEVLKHRDPVLVKMSFQQWLNIPHNKFVFELDEYQAKRLYEQDMSRVEKYEELKKKSGKGRNRVAQATSEETAPLSDPIIPAIWGKPATAHANDDEFEGPITFNSGSDGGWWYENNGTSGSYSTTAIDKYTAYNSGDMRVHINETHTPSWMRLQPPKDSNWHYLAKKVTVPTNMLVYCRFRFTQHEANSAADNPRIVFMISDEATGLYNNYDNNYLNVEVDSTETTVRAARHDGSSYGIISSTTDVDSKGQAIEYLALHKVGDTYHYWAGTESNWIYMGSHTNAYTPAMLRLGFHTHNQNHILSLDFIRFIETDKFPF